MYRIDLATLLAQLQEFRQSGRVYADFPAGIPTIMERGQAWLEVIEGKVISCVIINNNGQSLVSGNAALRLLYQLGDLKWTIETSEDAASYNASDKITELSPLLQLSQLSPSSGKDNSPVPRRLVSVSSQELGSWPRTYRRVYVLIDGERSMNKIADLLSLARGREEVYEILFALQSRGLIEVE